MRLKHVIALVMALVVNVVSASAISLASGLPFAGVLGGGAVLSLFGGAASGVLNMGLQVEVWHNAIVGNLFADNSFLSKAFNADDYVNDKKVHIPNAGAPSKVQKNRGVVPAAVNKRTDRDVEYEMDEYTTDPIYIPNAEEVELSYSKRESVIHTDRSAIHDSVADGILFKWSPKAAFVIRTTGSAVDAHLKGATGSRKGCTVKDFENAMSRMNAANISQEGRYALLDAQMYSQLLNDMTKHESIAFHALADVKNGVVGKLMTFNVMLRSKSLAYTSALAAIERESDHEFDATDNAGALLWQEGCVCRSLGLVKMFGKEDDPTYYGSIYSFLLRAGGTIMRYDGAGVIALVQDEAEDGYVAPRTFSTKGVDITTGQPISEETINALALAISQLAETSKEQSELLAELKASLETKEDTKLSKAAIRKLNRKDLEQFIAVNKLEIVAAEGETNTQLAERIIEALGEDYFA